MVPFRPIRYTPVAPQNGGSLGQLKTNDNPPTTVEVVQTMAVVLAAGAGATLTLLGIASRDADLTKVLKIALGTGLATISISTLFFGFKLE